MYRVHDMDLGKLLEGGIVDSVETNIDSIESWPSIEGTN